jgi:hypothetical protein
VLCFQNCTSGGLAGFTRALSGGEAANKVMPLAAEELADNA